MKTKFRLLLLVSVIFANLIDTISQDIVPFPLPGSEWRFAVYDYNNPYGNIAGYYKNTISGDTIIGDFTYKKLMQTGLNGNEFGYVAGIRQDESTGKVFIKSDNTFCGHDTLLYDFGLQIGDTLKQCPEIIGGVNITVQ